MAQFEVKNDFYDKSTGDLVTVGQVVEADEEREKDLRAAGVIGKAIGGDESVPVPPVTLSAEEFAELAAGEQKLLLENLGIQGDLSNVEKRTALYVEHLGKVPAAVTD